VTHSLKNIEIEKLSEAQDRRSENRNRLKACGLKAKVVWDGIEGVE